MSDGMMNFVVGRLCPDCGSSDLSISTANDGATSAAGQCCVYCEGCGTSGFWANSIHEAVQHFPVRVRPSPTKTLRDEFAMAALTGLLADGTICTWPAYEAAVTAYQYADAMMQEREKTNAI